MTGPLLHGRQTCSLIPVGVELDLTAPTPRHRARRAEDPPTMWTPFGGKHRRPDPAPDGWTLLTDERLAARLLLLLDAHATHVWRRAGLDLTLEDRPMQTNNLDAD